MILVEMIQFLFLVVWKHVPFETVIQNIQTKFNHVLLSPVFMLSRWNRVGLKYVNWLKIKSEIWDGFAKSKKQCCQLAEHQGRRRGCNFVCSKSAPYHSLEMHEPLARHVKLRVVHEPGMPGTFTPRRVSDPDMHRGLCVTHVRDAYRDR